MKEFESNCSQSGSSKPKVNRRTFLGGLTAAALAGITWPNGFLEAARTAKSDQFGNLLPTRALGDTGESVTMLGIGGQHYRWLPEDQLEERSL